MSRNIFLLALLTVCLCGRALRSRTIVLEGGRPNNLYFACGSANPTPILDDDDYSYSFSGLPQWLSARGSTLVGIPPAGLFGSYIITVRYTSTGGWTNSVNVVVKVGNGVWTTSTDDSSDNSVIYFPNSAYRQNNIISSSSGQYVVLLPASAHSPQVSSAQTIQIQSTPAPEPVSCTAQEINVNLAKTSVDQAKAALDKTNADISESSRNLDEAKGRRDALNS